MILHADVFLDTAILLYASNGRHDEPVKHEICLGLLTMPFGLSAQVLLEFYASATCHGAKPLSQSQAKDWLVNLAKKPCQSLDHHIVRQGAGLAESENIPFRAGTIIAAAQALGCKTIYSEDLKHAQRYDNVEVINPFL